MKTDKHEIVFEMYFNEYKDKDMTLMNFGLNHMIFVNGNIDIELNDAFKLMEDDRKFDCIFMNHPFGMRIRQMKNEDSYINLFSNFIDCATNCI